MNILLTLDLSNGLVHAAFYITAMYTVVYRQPAKSAFASKGTLANCYAVPCERSENSSACNCKVNNPTAEILSQAL